MKERRNRRVVSSRMSRTVKKALPEKIRIKRVENYRTHYIGRSADGIQFMEFIVGAPMQQTDRTHHTLRWYAVLHRFNSEESIWKPRPRFWERRNLHIT